AEARPAYPQVVSPSDLTKRRIVIDAFACDPRQMSSFRGYFPARRKPIYIADISRARSSAFSTICGSKTASNPRQHVKEYKYEHRNETHRESSRLCHASRGF